MRQQLMVVSEMWGRRAGCGLEGRWWPLVGLGAVVLSAVACSNDGEVDDETLVAACEATAGHVAGLEEARSLMSADILEQELAAVEATRDQYDGVDEVEAWLEDLAVGGELVADASGGDGGTDTRLAGAYLRRGRAHASIVCAGVDVDVPPAP